MRRSTVFLIPSQWSGDENDPIPWTYGVWYWLYRRVRIARHRLRLHDWRAQMNGMHCDWCGASRPR